MDTDTENAPRETLPVIQGVHRAEWYFVRRYQKLSRQYSRAGEKIIRQTGIASLWKAVGEQQRAAAAEEKAQRLQNRRSEIAVEINALVAALSHLGIDAQRVDGSPPPSAPPPPPPPPSQQYPA